MSASNGAAGGFAAMTWSLDGSSPTMKRGRTEEQQLRFDPRSGKTVRFEGGTPEVAPQPMPALNATPSQPSSSRASAPSSSRAGGGVQWASSIGRSKKSKEVERKNAQETQEYHRRLASQLSHVKAHEELQKQLAVQRLQHTLAQSEHGYALSSNSQQVLGQHVAAAASRLFSSITTSAGHQLQGLPLLGGVMGGGGGGDPSTTLPMLNATGAQQQRPATHPGGPRDHSPNAVTAHAPDFVCNEPMPMPGAMPPSASSSSAANNNNAAGLQLSGEATLPFGLGRFTFGGRVALPPSLGGAPSNAPPPNLQQPPRQPRLPPPTPPETALESISWPLEMVLANLMEDATPTAEELASAGLRSRSRSPRPASEAGASEASSGGLDQAWAAADGWAAAMTEVESALGALPADFLDDDQPVRAATPGHSRTSSNGSFKKLPETKDVVESFFA